MTGFSFGRAVMMAVFGLSLCAGAGHAADGVQLKISVIHATKAATKADPSLRKLQKSLKRSFGKRYKGFKLLDKEVFKLKSGGSNTVKLPNGKAAKFTYRGAKGKEHQLQFAVPQDKLDIALRAPLNKMFYQAGMRYGSGKDKGILILAMYLRAP